MLRLVAVLVFLLSAAAFAPSRVASRPRSKLSLNLPIIEPEQFEFFNSKLRMNRQLTRICQSLRSLKKESDCENPVVEAWYTADGQNLLDDGKFVLMCCSFALTMTSCFKKSDVIDESFSPGIPA